MFYVGYIYGKIIAGLRLAKSVFIGSLMSSFIVNRLIAKKTLFTSETGNLTFVKGAKLC